MECNGMQWNAMEWNVECGMQWNVMECNGMWNAMEWNAMEWNAMEWNGMQCNGMEWNGLYLVEGRGDLAPLRLEVLVALAQLGGGGSSTVTRSC